MNEEKKPRVSSVSKRYKASLAGISRLQRENYSYWRMCRLRRRRIMNLIRKEAVLKETLALSIIANIVAVGVSVINLVVGW